MVGKISAVAGIATNPEFSGNSDHFLGEPERAGGYQDSPKH
jgi:hypothetical protein